MLLNEAIIMGSMMWGLFITFLVIHIFVYPDFKKKIKLLLKRISGRKFVFLLLKVLGVLTLLYFAGGVEFDMVRFLNLILLFSGIMIFILMRLLGNLHEIKVPILTPKEIRREKLKKIQSKSLIYRIKNII